MTSPRSKRVRLQGWEEFDEPVDRIVSLGAFEHFADGIGSFDRYDDFFTTCHNVLPDDGVMLLHSIVVPSADEMQRLRLKTTMSLLRFIKFILTEIFPGGRLPMISTVEEHATRAGFRITRQHRIGSNYVRTLDSWAKALEMHKDEAIAIQSEQVYLRYMHYLTGCRELFREGYTDVCQFSMVKT
jgi:cyclopropane-fatty-acyl-phospholipid synthase